MVNVGDKISVDSGVCVFRFDKEEFRALKRRIVATVHTIEAGYAVWVGHDGYFAAVPLETADKVA